MQENYRIFSSLQAATFIWNRFNTVSINGNNRKISWACIARSVWQHVTCSWERILVERVFPLLSRKVTGTIQTPLLVPWYSRACSGRGEALKAHPPLATMLKQKLELYFYSKSWPSYLVLRRILLLFYRKLTLFSLNSASNVIIFFMADTATPLTNEL